MWLTIRQSVVIIVKQRFLSVFGHWLVPTVLLSCVTEQTLMMMSPTDRE
jgi:hypothetical protein